MGTELDEHGQPLAPFRAKARENRTVDELVGICKGIVADGKVSEDEANFIVKWMNENAYMACNRWPINMLLDRLERMLSDKVINAEERKELFGILSGIVGGIPVADRIASFSSSLDLDTPSPLVFDGSAFCFTGRFAYGTRSDCEEAVSSRGATVLPSISKKVNFLIVGLMGSRDWLHSTFGLKMEKAFAYRQKYGLMVVGEDHWANFL